MEKIKSGLLLILLSAVLFTGCVSTEAKLQVYRTAGARLTDCKKIEFITVVNDGSNAVNRMVNRLPETMADQIYNTGLSSFSDIYPGKIAGRGVKRVNYENGVLYGFIDKDKGKREDTVTVYLVVDSQRESISGSSKYFLHSSIIMRDRYLDSYITSGYFLDNPNPLFSYNLDYKGSLDEAFKILMNGDSTELSLAGALEAWFSQIRISN